MSSLNYWLYTALDWLFGGGLPTWTVLSFFTIFIYLLYLGEPGFFLGLFITGAPPLAWKYLYKEA